MGTSKAKKGGIFETLKTIVYALLIAGLFRTLLFQPFWIPSGSMKDTLLIGDFLFVNKMAYGYSYASCPTVRFGPIDIDAKDICGWMGTDQGRIWASTPERGDVVVFRHPVNGSDYIKRLIGLPGDRVQMRMGVIYLNDKPLLQEDAGVFDEIYAPQGPHALAPRCANGPIREGDQCQKRRLLETNPEGRQYHVLDIGTQSLDNTPVYTVPEGQFFFMGDNRDNSTDSRVPQRFGGVGFVPFENLVGRADRVLFSSAGSSMLYFWTWRSDRFFKGVE
jgi:signal peptidase I